MSGRDREIVRLYREGFSSAGIGRMYGITANRVLQILRARGVERRKPKPTSYLDLRRAS
jgi:hypothetical protein